MTIPRNVPLWVFLISGFMGILSLSVGISLYLIPGTFLPGMEFAPAGARFATNMWAARQVALGAVMAFASGTRNGGMLTGALAVYGVMNIQDAAIGAMKGDAPLVFGAVFFGAVAACLIVTIRRPPRQ